MFLIWISRCSQKFQLGSKEIVLLSKLTVLMKKSYIQMELMTLCLTQADDFTTITWKHLKCVIFVSSGICYIF